MNTMILLVVFQTVILPVIFAVWLAMARLQSKVHWVFLVFLVMSYLAMIYQAGPWSWFTINLKYAMPVLAFASLAMSLRHLKGLPLGPPRKFGSIFNLIVISLVGAVVFLQAMAGLGGSVQPGKTIDLAFPLEGGRYVVGQGGDSPILNYHNAYPTQTYALDILGLYKNGRRAKGLWPEELEKYAIYGARIVSPCDGTILETEDGHEDQKPGLPNEPKNPAGNYVVVACGEVNVLLAHMQPSSISVAKGEDISKGDPIGLVGNSGNTSEPHLHIHAEKAGTDKPMLKGEAVAITFDGEYLIRNDVVER